ncbi:Uncharacterized protein BM_BM17194 [Brugia malayi]|uniref:Uncharacterized protein n=1 Tax=Brugia malayi TaxID=6279 RepID=A0A4E9G0N7_BRUMA|nr:Uncharacterized protein BM_BM17194 [Brugia malayi]VIP00289.1 Uncharacterized protein BM_BM17194 [Brugia malayi]
MSVQILYIYLFFISVSTSSQLPFSYLNGGVLRTQTSHAVTSSANELPPLNDDDDLMMDSASQYA